MDICELETFVKEKKI